MLSLKLPHKKFGINSNHSSETTETKNNISSVYTKFETF